MPSVDLPIPVESCPGREALAAYTAGKLPSAALEAVAAHVAGCPACQSTLGEVQDDTSEDPLVGRLRRCAAAGPASGGAPSGAAETVVPDSGTGTAIWTAAGPLPGRG